MFHVHGQGDSILSRYQLDYRLNLTYRFNAIPIKILPSYFVGVDKSNSKIYMEWEKTHNIQVKIQKTEATSGPNYKMVEIMTVSIL